MVLPDEARTFAGRLTSFERPVHLAKRRASSSTRKKNPTTASWPHEFLDPVELARAGFYYKPTATEHDNVTCFMCHKSLAGWEHGDNAASEHLVHSPECPWAMYACISQRSDEQGRTEDAPSDERLVVARSATFQDSWPHEGKKGWKCKTKKMVEAGWCYDPSPECDDGVTCFYCNVSLDGWEPKDDPWEEHRKRSPDCYFFAVVGTKKKATTRKPRGSQASKASRQSRQSSITAFSEAPSLMSLGDVEPFDGDSVLTTGTNATSATVTSMPGDNRKGRPKSKAAPKGKRQGHGKATAKDVEETIPDEPTIATEEATEEQHIPKPTRKTRKKAAEHVDESQVESVASTKSQPVRKTGRKKKVEEVTLPEVEDPEQRLSEDASQLVSELMAAAEPAVPSEPQASVEHPAKPTRGTKRTSEGIAKADSSLVMLEDAPSHLESQQMKPKRGKKGIKQAKELAVTQETVEVLEPSSVIDQTVDSQATSASSKPKRGRKAKQTKIKEQPPAISPSKPASPPPENSEHSEPEPVVSTDEDAAHLPQQPEKTVETTPPAPLSRSAAAKTMTPSPSPQSSDAENKPPSSRLSSHPASQHRQASTRTPLAPTTPIRSPSKHNIINGAGLATTHPWHVVDLETVFLPSPKSNKAVPSSSLSARLADAAAGKENLSNVNVQKPLAEVVQEVKARLTSPEKKMSVEEWICYNAKRGEGKMREECERLVSIFETEGGKAMRALEGIQCLP